ncbi:hypothetical protein Zm00014a_022504 [Zea mays]|jgi:hypothetical protein|uniref:Uncharacterized protein n=2 Tax=Zea mays TaxID=4577 RepID=A0A8J8YSG7_MAIZE|nr:hypothetical protein ZEAMMB73_Zm00001d040925 [Zea mays]PWZ31245.1 hypothetical protein Zm00014a_022504 [Zea mays]
MSTSWRLAGSSTTRSSEGRHKQHEIGNQIIGVDEHVVGTTWVDDEVHDEHRKARQMGRRRRTNFRAWSSRRAGAGYGLGTTKGAARLERAGRAPNETGSSGQRAKARRPGNPGHGEPKTSRAAMGKQSRQGGDLGWWRARQTPWRAGKYAGRGSRDYGRELKTSSTGNRNAVQRELCELGSGAGGKERWKEREARGGRRKEPRLGEERSA